MIIMTTSMFRLIVACLLLCTVSIVEAALRDDVLIIVNDNSVDSPALGAYYAQQRGIDPANIVHVRVPAGYFISWTEFRSLRDQLIDFMQRHTLDDPALVPVVCSDGEPPYYCPASMQQLRSHSRIRYLVTTRGVPTRMVVDGSPLYDPSAPTSVDNYLKYWLVNYFAADTWLNFTQRETAFGDGRGMRTVLPATDRELIVGRIDGLSLDSARALLDRTLAAERQGLFGRLFGSTRVQRWVDYTTGRSIYPPDGTAGWPYQLGLFGEARPECLDYLGVSGLLPAGKTPAHCTVALNDDADPVTSANYPAPGNAASRQPQAVDALIYQGWLDGQAAAGSYNALLNWRKNDQCTVTECRNAADPAACRAASTDIFGELNTDCVGVAAGFMGYNHQSWPASYLAVWPTGWFQSTSNSSWNDDGHGDVNQLAFPEVRTDTGFDDNYSLWFRNSDQVTDPRCYPDSDFTAPPGRPCADQRRVVLTQRLPLAAQPLGSGNPRTYRIALRYRVADLATPVTLQVRLFVREAGGAQVDYGTRVLATLAPGSSDWTLAQATFPLDPALHAAASYDGIKFRIETAGVFAGVLGIDAVSVQEVGTGVELAQNGSFSAGHRQTAAGDHAATFLDRLGGVAFWGSVSHHESAGCAFCLSGMAPLNYFLRGLPLGDAVWFDSWHNSGILYGDPLYSPAAVRLNPVNATDTLSGVVDLTGSTVNGRDPARVSTRYRIDICPGKDFFTCDEQASWQPTGLAGVGGAENMLLGSWDSASVAPGPYTLRLAVTSQQTTTGRSQTLHDYYPMQVAPAVPVDLSGTVKTAAGVDICAVVLASGRFTFSCNPPGVFSLTGLPRAPDGTVKRQIYADGFLPKIDVVTGSVDEAVVMTPSGNCPSYNTPYSPGVYPATAGQLVDISGTVRLQNSQTPVCAMVLANGKHMFSCDGSGSYAMRIRLDSNGQYKLQVYADGFAPAVQSFDILRTNDVVKMTRITECH